MVSNNVMSARYLSGRFGGRGFGRVAICALLLAGGCQRTPQTAADLEKALPQAFAGELHLQGETEPQRIRVEARELSIRSEHVLEFNRIDYRVRDDQGGPGSEGEAHIRGTITAPGFEIRLESLGPDVAGGGDAIRLETFSGKLSGNLQALDAEWSTGFGQKAKLTMQAAPP
jgi:hypothetical protein